MPPFEVETRKAGAPTGAFTCRSCGKGLAREALSCEACGKSVVPDRWWKHPWVATFPLRLRKAPDAEVHHYAATLMRGESWFFLLFFVATFLVVAIGYVFFRAHVHSLEVLDPEFQTRSAAPDIPAEARALLLTQHQMILRSYRLVLTIMELFMAMGFITIVLELRTLLVTRRLVAMVPEDTGRDSPPPPA